MFSVLSLNRSHLYHLPSFVVTQFSAFFDAIFKLHLSPQNIYSCIRYFCFLFSAFDILLPTQKSCFVVSILFSCFSSSFLPPMKTSILSLTMISARMPNIKALKSSLTLHSTVSLLTVSGYQLSVNVWQGPDRSRCVSGSH